MKKYVLDWLKANRSIAIQCLVVFGLSVFVTSLILRPKSKVSLSGEGYDFNSRRAKEFSGPTIGETLNVSAMQAEDGRSLPEVAAESPYYMIAVVDPNCGACKAAQSQMKGIREGLKNRGIPFFFVMLSDDDSKPKYFAYVKSLGQESRGFIWQTNGIPPPPSSLVEMVVPTHLLLNRDGMVLDKWPGTHQDPVMRQRMVNQVLSDSINTIAVNKNRD
jgi:hypothetical protein